MAFIVALGTRGAASALIDCSDLRFGTRTRKQEQARLYFSDLV